MRSGYVNLPGVSGATLRNAGLDGYGWSSRASSTRSDGAAIPSAYNLNFGPSDVNPSNGPYERWNGRPLRCFVPAGGADLFYYLRMASRAYRNSSSAISILQACRIVAKSSKSTQHARLAYSFSSISKPSVEISPPTTFTK